MPGIGTGIETLERLWTAMGITKNICTVCNYIYDETVGEPRQNISPSVPFDSLLELWCCPECKAGKEMFQPCSCVSVASGGSIFGHEETCSLTRTEIAAAAFSKTALVGEVVAQFPQCARVFESHGIDYCCGGKVPLEVACKKKDLDFEKLAGELAKACREALPKGERDWTKTSLNALVEHIVSAYHKPLRAELRRTLPLAQKVARVHGEAHPEMNEVMRIFSLFKEQLEMHMHKEEMVLFPTIASMESGIAQPSFGCGGGIQHPITAMMLEHEDAGEAMARMSRLTNSYTPPEDACNSFRVLLHSLARIESEMHQHVHKENNILFVRAIDLFGPSKDKVETLGQQRCSQ